MKTLSIELKPGKRLLARRQAAASILASSPASTPAAPVSAQPATPLISLASLARVKAQVAFWHRMSIPTAPRALRAARAAICAACEHGLPTRGNLILGTCKQPGCCSKGKPVLARSSCPLPQPKWSALPPAGNPLSGPLQVS